MNDIPANDDDKATAEAEAFEKVEHALEELHAGMAEMVGVAVFHHRAGRLEQAEKLYRAIIESQPRNINALHMLGVLLAQKNEIGEGVALIERAAALAPDNPEILSALGTMLHNAGRLPESGAIFQKALFAAPGHTGALYGLGTVRMAAGDLQGARTALETAAAGDPGHLNAALNLGNVLLKLGEAEAALACYDEIISRHPAAALIHHNRADALRRLGRMEDVREALETAVRLNPDVAAGYNNLAAFHLEAGRTGEAADLLEATLAKNPDNPETLFRLGTVRRAQGGCDAALGCFDAVIEKHPNHGEARWNRAQTLLAMGDFARGWPECEWRWARPGAPSKPVFPGKPWTGGDPAEQRLFIYSEPDAGETIQFIRCAKVLADRGASVILGCGKDLSGLLARTPGVEAVITAGGAIPDIDGHQSLLSLPMILGTEIETIPAEIPYIFADPKRTAAWAGRLADTPGMKIGVDWRGAAKRPGRQSQSLNAPPAEAFAPLGDIVGEIEGVSYINLRSELPGPPESPESPGPPGLMDMGPSLAGGDMEETAALIANLDLIITVDSPIAHLAGAMGKPVWTLLSAAPDWRWLLEREDSPWYPAMRLYRQTAPGAWDGPAARAAADLRALLRGPLRDPLRPGAG